MSIRRALGKVVVTAHGVLGTDTSRQLRHILWDLIDQQGNRNVVVDLRAMTVGHGADLELFVDESHSARRRGGHLTLSGPGDDTSEAFSRAGITEAPAIEASGSRPKLVATG